MGLYLAYNAVGHVYIVVLSLLNWRLLLFRSSCLKRGVSLSNNDHSKANEV